MRDHEIIELYWARNESAITATAEKYGNYCHTIAYNILRNKEDAEECANDTYLGAWNSIPPQRPSRLSIYLGKITRNLALNRYKRYTAEKRGHGQVVLALSELEACVPSKTTVEQTVEENELAAAIDRFLYAKPKLNRNIFVRRYYHLYAIRDIADAYGMSESKVTSLLFRKIIPLAPEFIGLEKAKPIALEDAGLDEATQKIVFTREELSRNQGKPYYILEFCTDKCAYSYKVDAVSGDILEKNIEWRSLQESEPVSETVQSSDSNQRRIG